MEAGREIGKGGLREEGNKGRKEAVWWGRKIWRSLRPKN